MLSQLLGQLDHTVGTFSSALCLACAGLVLFGGHFLVRRARRRAVPVLFDSKRVPPTDDREERVAVALQHSAIPVLVSDELARVDPVRGFVVEHSVTGLRLELSEEGQVDPCAVLSVKPAGVSNEFPWVKVQVERCQALKGCCHLHCRYLQTPPYSVRMLFG
jgi:hypothetical protein